MNNNIHAVSVQTSMLMSVAYNFTLNLDLV